VILLFVFFSLTANAQNPELPRGQVIDTLECLDSPGQLFALYLPSQYDSLRKWPVIFFFEPSARGKLPIEKYKVIAEQFGYILLGSYNSKNGPRDIIFEAQKSMFKDAKQRFSIDEERIFTSGFSGGARASIAIAVTTKEVRGVISCAGTFPADADLHPTASDRFVFAGIVGNKDMNYNEHGRFRLKLDSISLPNILIHFDAGHEWPPVDVYRKAVEWLEVRTNNSASTNFWAGYESTRLSEAKKEEEAENHLSAFSILEQLRRDSPDGKTSGELEDLYEKVKSSKGLKKEQKAFNRIDNQEKKLIDNFHEGIQWVYQNGYNPQIKVDSIKFSFEWWRVEIEKLQLMANSKNQDRSLMAQRMIELIWVNAITRILGLMPIRSYDVSLSFGKIWLMATPESSWVHYWMGRIQAGKGENLVALEHLIKAVELGFPTDRLHAPEFSVLERNKEFLRLRDIRRKD